MRFNGRRDGRREACLQMPSGPGEVAVRVADVGNGLPIAVATILTIHWTTPIIPGFVLKSGSQNDSAWQYPDRKILGIEGFVMKPIERNLVAATIRKVLGGR